MTFKTSLDNTAKERTIGSALLFLSSAIGFSLLSDMSWMIGLAFLFGMGLLFLFMFLIKPIKYELSRENIIIHRLWRKVNIPRKDIKYILEYPYDVFKTTIGGAFGYVGKLNTDRGVITSYATRRDNVVMITTHDNKNIVLTPDEPEDFIAFFHSY